MGGNHIDDLLSPLLGALQACISVLLTIFYGLVARRLKLVSEGPINELNRISVQMFLPALLIVNLGSNLHLENALNYIPVLGMVILEAGICAKLTLDSLTYSLVADLHDVFYWSRILFNKSLQPSSLGYTSVCIQQYDITAPVITPVTRECRLSQTNCPR